MFGCHVSNIRCQIIGKISLRDFLSHLEVIQTVCLSQVYKQGDVVCFWFCEDFFLHLCRQSVYRKSAVAVLRMGPEGAMAPPEGGNNNLGRAQIAFRRNQDHLRRRKNCWTPLKNSLELLLMVKIQQILTNISLMPWIGVSSEVTEPNIKACISKKKSCKKYGI